jgi:mannose-6-phosphate isomerase
MAAFGKSADSAWVPFRISPWFSERIWGYSDLKPWYDKVAEEEPIGEAWLTGDQCVVAGGVHAGKTLDDLFAENPESLLGSAAPHEGSPLLIKVIFAKEKLSVQVHPDDAMAQKYGDLRGKTECWYILATEPGAQVACGLNSGVTLNEVKAGIETDTLENSLNVLDVAPGEVVFVDAGTVHAILPGVILLETQQNCDVTYRMYDYGRGRELNIKKSLEATKIETRAGKVPSKVLDDRTILMDGEYFLVERIAVSGSRTGASLAAPDQPEHGLQYLFAATGGARITGTAFEPVELPRGGIVAIPAACPEFVVEDLGGLELIRITPRWPKGIQ